MGDPAAIAAAFGGGLPPGISGTNDRCTVLVSNLNPDVSSHSFSLSLSNCEDLASFISFLGSREGYNLFF